MTLTRSEFHMSIVWILQTQSQVLIVADGEAVFLPTVTHNVKDIGGNEIVIVETELK